MVPGQGADGSKQTVVQKLPTLIEWYLSSNEVELKFVPNDRRAARLAPEFDFEYWMNDRRISERALSMIIQTELARMNYSFSLGKIIGGLTALAWGNYIENCEYPQWMRDGPAIVPKRPRGRPRKHPKPIDFDEKPVNTKVLQDNTLK